MRTPFYGARRMAAVLRRQGYVVDRKHIRRLMQIMGIEAIYRKPNLSRRHPQHKIYPYLLRNVTVDRVNQVWSCDITYIPMKHGFLYLFAIVDWFSRKILARRLSITLDADFCVEALEEALAKYGKPEIFNSDQGVQFTCEAFIGVLEREGIAISMDGRGRCLDNIFIERFWKSLKYEEVYLHAYETIPQAVAGITRWVTFYNTERLHQSLKYQTPDEIYAAGLATASSNLTPAAPALSGMDI